MAPARTLCSLALALAGLASTAVSQVITGFGSAEQNPLNINTDFVFPWSGTQNATTVSVTDVPNGVGGGIFQSLSGSPVFLPNPESLSLTGTTVSLPGGVTQFNVVLYDADNDTLTASFDWASFTGGATVLSNLVTDGEFDGTVTSWGLSLFGSSTEEVSFTFDELSVVPEPAVVALIAGAGGVMLLLRRRRSARI